MLLDISKTFDKLWHEGFIYKLGHNRIFCYSLKLLESFSNNRKKLVLNGQCSKSSEVDPGVDQGLILGLLLCLIDIADLSENLKSNSKLIADDTSLFSVIRNLSSTAEQIYDDLRKVHRCRFQRKRSFNPDPSMRAKSRQDKNIILQFISIVKKLIKFQNKNI